MIKKLSLSLLALVVALAVAVGINTARKGSRQIQVQPLAPIAVDEKAVAERLQQS